MTRIAFIFWWPVEVEMKKTRRKVVCWWPSEASVKPSVGDLATRISATVDGIRQHPVLGTFRDGMAVVDENDRSEPYAGEPSVWCGWCFIMMIAHSRALHDQSVGEMKKRKRH
jgi:hypothetical protein